MPIPHFYHHDDPTPPTDEKGPIHVWHFVYLHGEAEQYNQAIGIQRGWDAAPDLIASDQPMPTEEGEYEASLYGQLVIAVLSKSVGGNFMKGRAALSTDRVALAHARKPEDWR